jgi:hypothetical protein
VCNSHPRALTRGLWSACQGGWLRTTKLLLDYGADVDRVLNEWNVKEGPALHWVILGGNADVVLLLGYGARVPNQASIWWLAEKRSGSMAEVIEQAWKGQQGEAGGKKRRYYSSMLHK